MLIMQKEADLLFRFGERTLGYWNVRLLTAMIMVWSVVAIIECGRIAHDLLCADHGVWPIL